MSTAVGGLAAEAGLEPALLGPLPAPGVDGDLDPAALSLAEERGRAARTLVDGRRRVASDLRKLAQQTERAEHEAIGAEDRAAGSEAEVDRERAQVGAAGVAHDAAEQAWSADIKGWAATGSAAALEMDWEPVFARLAARQGEPTWVAAVRRAVADALARPLQIARQAAADSQLAVAGAENALAVAEVRLAEVEEQAEARPEPARLRDAERDPAAGAPLYELVDLAPGISTDEGAGLEAALEASGLLDAWVHADGLVVHPDTRDTLLHAGSPACAPGVPTLAQALVPAPTEGGPVGRDTIEGVLAAIGLGDHAGDAWVSPGGRWSLGVVGGAWHKNCVEFLGAAARRATRERLLADLRGEVDARRADLAVATARADAAAAHRDAVEALPSTLPTADAIDETARDLLAAERTLAAARARHDADRRRAETARAAANRLAAAMAHQAVAEGLPTTVDDLDRVVAALAELRDALAEHHRALRDLGHDSQRLRSRLVEEADRRVEAAATLGEARQRRGDHDTAALELATLRQALAATVDAVLVQHAEVSARLVELDDALVPAAEQARRDADADRATAVARLGAARTVEDQAMATLVEAAHALEAAVALPGVLLAATGIDTHQLGAEPDPVPTGAALAAAVAPLVDGDDAVTDGTILSRYDRLSEALPGGYDTAIDEEDGVKVVHVADDSGRQPLAVVAARLADEAEAARGRLAAREREVLERFLLRELADEVRSKLLDAHDLVTGANRTLAGVHTSHGKGAHLEWRLRDDAEAPAGVAARLLVDELRDEAADGQLRDALLALIDAERAIDPSAGYEQHLRSALDYRGWHRFTVKVTDAAHPGSSRTLSSKLGLSQGEQRVLSYLALFAAAASHFEAIARDTPTAPRLILLDDAFAKVDEPTHGRLLGLLVDLELDFVLTSERMWGCFPSVPSLEIYEAVRDPVLPGVALVHFRWDGHQRHLVGV